jgi:hypothetical protein
VSEPRLAALTPPLPAPSPARSRPALGLALALGGALLALCASPALARAQFGIESLEVEESSSQAGAHPDVSATFAFNGPEPSEAESQLKSATVELPAGLLGDPGGIENCSQEAFQELHCAKNAQIGVLEAAFPAKGESESPPEPLHIPLFDLTPSPGHLATFGGSLLFASLFVQVDAQQKDGEPTGKLIATISGIPTFVPLTEATLTLTLWGIPAEPSHDTQRCNQLLLECGPPESRPAPTPFISNPTDCDGQPLEVALAAESWQGATAAQTATLPPIEGCNELSLPRPELQFTPDTTQRDSPSGYDLDLAIPQYGEPDGDGLATPVLREIAITLPPGTSLSPGVAQGLEACNEAQLETDTCPNASQVGTVEIATLGAPLLGAVYIASPAPGEPYRLFVHASTQAIAVNLTGHIDANPGTGQLTAVVENTLPFPFSALKLRLFGGPNAALANPLACGPTAGSVSLHAAVPETLTAEATSVPFLVDANGNGGPCPPSFTPTFTAGTTPAIAGHSAVFTLGLSRADGQPFLSTFAVHLPPGLTGMLSSLTPCPEARAAAGACPSSSTVGIAKISAGAGTDPLTASGPVYLTGPYEGAPFGLAVVIHAAAGPFDLGTVMVRSRVLVDPSTLALTVASDPLPQILAGIPLRLRTLQITLDRPKFVTDPTTCAPQQILATIGDQEGVQATLASPFRVKGCAKLRFAPRLSASTDAGGSVKGNGASLALKISSPAASTATLRSAIVELPAALRPRLKTIQHACLSAGSAILPSACPPESRIGVATVRTPILAAPLTGAIYLVAHGGANLPTLVMALQGDGVSVQFPGVLSISRHGSISAAFRALPDAPISAFELRLPRGPHSILGAVSSLCARAMKLPYELTDQTGAHIDATTRVAVSGCPRANAARRRRRPRHT